MNDLADRLDALERKNRLLTRTLIMLPLCAVALVVTLSWNTRTAEAADRTPVEYLVVGHNSGQEYAAALEADLTKCGKDGWQLVTVDSYRNLIFKR